jgi:hypothetical protein
LKLGVVKQKSHFLIKFYKSLILADSVDQRICEELQAFLNISKELNAGGTTGSEIYPGELLPLINENVILSNSILNLLIDYYNRAYVKYNFSRP